MRGESGETRKLEQAVAAAQGPATRRVRQRDDVGRTQGPEDRARRSGRAVARQAQALALPDGPLVELERLGDPTVRAPGPTHDEVVDHPMRRITREIAFDPDGWGPARAAKVAAARK